MEPVERVVPHFREELEQLKARLLEMGGLAEEEVRLAVRGLVERDDTLIGQVIRGDGPLNSLHIEIDNRSFMLLALHQPMAADLRSIVSAVKINTDLERVGDLAVNIAEAAQRYAMHPPVKRLIDIPQMARIAQSMLRDALDAFVRQDTDLAQQVLSQDDKLDALKDQIFRELLTYMLQDPTTIEPSLDLILDFPPPRTHRRPRHQYRRRRHLHRLGQRRPPPRRRFGPLRVANSGPMPEPALCVLCRRHPVDPAWRPFCSERCKLQDLARWAEGAYRVPGEPVPEPEDDTNDKT